MTEPVDENEREVQPFRIVLARVMRDTPTPRLKLEGNTVCRSLQCNNPLT
jgi:hypothetical protein